MKKLKKLFAVMLSLIMVLAMGITSFADEAAPTATITVNGLDKNATVTYKQIIRPNTKTETGWEFIDPADITAFGYSAADEQTVIWKLIKMVSGDAAVTNMPEGTTAFSTSEYQKAVGVITTSTQPTNPTITNDGDKKNVSWSVSSAGVYVVNANSEKEDGEATAYTYAPMAAYISFGSYNTETGVPSTLENATVTAKSTTVEITKEANETDKVVEVGKVVEYTITTKMPYVSDQNPIETFKLVDTIQGAEYVTEATGDNTGKVHVTGTVGTTVIDTYVDVQDRNSITIDLSNYLENNAHANQTVTLKYSAKVTDLVVNNTIQPNDGKHGFTPATESLYTGSVTLTKTGESDKKLEGAKFVLKKTLKKENNKVQYALVDTVKDEQDNVVVGVYKVTGWTDSLETAKATSNLMTTIANGTITVKGLDDTTDYVEYEFQEIEAPKGYSINKTNSEVTWNTEGAGVEAANRTGTASMTDTKLSALPATGGIGTTIFTIVGCGIMIAAAGLFFASRRKENR